MTKIEKINRKSSGGPVRYLPYNIKLKMRARKLRNNMTDPERKIWQFLRKLDLRVLRQKPIDNFIVDFYCAKKKLVIEIDGCHHYEKDVKEYDDYRTAILESYGLKVVRFSNWQVLKHFEVVKMVIYEIMYDDIK